MKKNVKKTFTFVAFFALSLVFTVAVYAASGSKNSVVFTSPGTGTELTGKLTKNYVSYVTPTSNFRDNPEITTEVSIKSLFGWHKKSSTTTTLVYFNSPHTVHWVANTNNTTKFTWKKSNSVEAGVTVATVGFYDN